jgi:hypothetical protein
MEIQTPYQNFLSILHGGKAVPYGGAQRPEGTTNHGFRPLKDKLEEVALIPEANKDESLAKLLAKINAPDTGLFSVGCVSGDVTETAGYKVSGYIEFAINDKKWTADAINYFKIFFHFTQKLIELKFTEKVTFNWDLLGATFFEANCSGFTCSVTVNTHFHATQELARNCWVNALAVLGDHLVEIKEQQFQRIY